MSFKYSYQIEKKLKATKLIEWYLPIVMNMRLFVLWISLISFEI